MVTPPPLLHRLLDSLDVSLLEELSVSYLQMVSVQAIKCVH